jgi:tRNA G18 (ribose-2'-O)-methylase SpoU
MEASTKSDPSCKAGQKRQLADGRKMREEKRRKWEAKQARTRENQEKEESRALWISQHEQFASLVTEVDATAIQNRTRALPSRLEALLSPYVNIQDTSTGKLLKDATGNSSEDRLFVAEGTETIRLLIQQSTQERKDGLKPIELKSIFVKPSILFYDPVNLLVDVEAARKKREDNKSPGFHVLVGSEAALSHVAGFQVSRGAMACGVIPRDCDMAWLENLIQSRLNQERFKKIRLLALDGICDTANLGSMVRCASAFGIDAIILSKDTCEAWYRRSIRVSMGHIFRVPVVRVDDLAAALTSWASRYPGLQSFAAVIDTDSLLGSIPHGKVPSSWCCVMGNESQGISKSVADACTQRITIDMEEGVDSLSVPIACGIILSGLREREPSSTS